MEKILYLEKISKKSFLIGNLLWLLGLSLLFFINVSKGPALLLIWIALIIGGIVILSNEGIELDFRNNKYRNIYSILGLNFGSWKNFPKIDYISIFRGKISRTIGNVGLHSTATAKITEEVILIKLFLENGKPTTLYLTKNEKTALEISKKIKAKYGVEIINKLKKTTANRF